ncbi:MAG TPA: hypothetical protein VK208_17485 [Pyrinomonadaceae bacterium]|nr:hypothetical protein [Pyrinomonadaceae bacterium]
MGELTLKAQPLLWESLVAETREALSGKLSGLWGAESDAAAFNGCAVDKQQTLLILLSRLRAKALWHVINKIDNVYGEGGVGIGFSAWPFIESTLQRRKDFTRLFANHKDTSGGFYEKGRGEAVLHFLYVEGKPRKWYVHFDLYSPVHSPASAIKHLRYEFLGKLTPDWRMIQSALHAAGRP